ncbi:helix-turn-helix domain-containing protein [Nocardia tengchongensis]|uniref:helix-turn-helix domain-containing protein n=1 Tax=Nocardia tengchongensis TaxID=2055889 RepID=UPI003619FADE
MSRSVIRGFVPSAFRDARERVGMSRGDLVRLAGIADEGTPRRWELGQACPQIDVLRRALAAINREAEQKQLAPVGVCEVIVTDAATRYLSDWRHLALLTQPELGRAVGLATSKITRLERGQVALGRGDAARLAAALGIDADEVVRAWERARARPAGALA